MHDCILIKNVLDFVHEAQNRACGAELADTGLSYKVPEIYWVRIDFYWLFTPDTRLTPVFHASVCMSRCV